MSAQPKLVMQAKGLVKRYGHVTALDGTDFELRAGEILAVIGDNGAGKSSLIKALSGATIPDEGEILLDGTPVGTASYGIRRPDVATVYPNAPEQIGFSYPLDTRPYPNGSHQLSVRAIDKSGNVAVLPGVTIVIHNGE